jgi:G2/mitotic-specific cyclin 3/4
MLQFELGWPGPMSFLRRISKADDYDINTRTLAKYLLEVTIIEEHFVASPPSFVAAVISNFFVRVIVGIIPFHNMFGNFIGKSALT